MIRSAVTAIFIALAIQVFTVGILAPRLPREVCRPGIQTERSFRLNNAPVLHLVNNDGAVRINTREEQKDILVTARIRAYTDNAEAQDIALNYISTLFHIEETLEIVTLITEPGIRPDPIDLRVNYLISAPPNLDIAVDVANGNVWIEEGCNNISIEGNNSDIEVLGPNGAVNIKTINGRIRAFDCLSDTTLETVNGSIHATLLSGLLQASTTTGAITATLLDNKVTGCDLTSLNGSITLVMPEQHSAKVNANTARGVVRTDLPIATRGIQKRRLLHGTLGTGDTAVSMNSMNGDIWIQRSAT